MAKDRTIGYYNDYDNVIDFIEIKMMKLADHYSKTNRLDLAEKIWKALDLYLDHKALIWFENGDPMIKAIESTPDPDNS